MEFKEAIKLIYEKLDRGLLKDSFLTLSTILDYVGSSIYDKALAYAFFEVDKRIHIYKTFETHSLAEGRRIISEDFKNHEYEHSGKEIAESINALTRLMHPVEFAEYEAKKTKKNPAKAQAIVVKANKPVKGKEEEKDNKKAVIIPAPNQKVNTPNNKIDISKYKSIHIRGACQRFNVMYGNVKEPTLLRTDVATGNTTSYTPAPVFGQLEVYVGKNKNATYYLMLPPGRYATLNITMDMTKVMVCGLDATKPFNVSKISLANKYGKTWIHSNTNKVDINAGCNNVTLMGTYGSIKGFFNTCSLEGMISINKRNQNPFIKVITRQGDINLVIEGLRYKVGHGIIHPTTRYDAFQEVDGKKVSFDLTTEKGKIHLNPSSKDKNNLMPTRS